VLFYSLYFCNEKEFFINQIKAMTAALSLPLSSVVTPFGGIQENSNDGSKR
jgi:hypothetical protein